MTRDFTETVASCIDLLVWARRLHPFVWQSHYLTPRPRHSVEYHIGLCPSSKALRNHRTQLRFSTVARTQPTTLLSTWTLRWQVFTTAIICHFACLLSALNLTLLVGWQEGRPVCKKLSVGLMLQCHHHLHHSCSITACRSPQFLVASICDPPVAVNSSFHASITALSALVLSPLRAQQFGILCLTVCVIQLLGLISFDVTWKRICLSDIASRLAH